MSDCRFGVSPVNYPDPDPGKFVTWLVCHLVSLFFGELPLASFLWRSSILFATNNQMF